MSTTRYFSPDNIIEPKVALAISYDGHRYKGWQIQTDPVVPTVQEEVERALTAIAAAPVKVHCAGRTDSGVHSTYQVVHFDNAVPRSAKAWVKGGNAKLPDDVAILWAQGVDEGFHARFSATARTYRYLIYNHPVRPAIGAGRYTWHRHALDHQRMHDDAQCLLGEHDFSSFRGAGCQSNSPFRYVEKVSVTRRGDVLAVEIKANAFLLHMVRNIVGVLLAVGDGQQPPGWTREVLAACDRTCAGVTAKPDGLYLIDVDYPDYDLPVSERGPVFFADQLD